MWSYQSLAITVDHLVSLARPPSYSSTMSITHGGVLYYIVKVPPSRDHEFDNPFRPDSDLSREAEHIVRMIKAGKPITTPVEDGEPRIPSPEPINSNHTSPVREHLATANNVYPNKSSPGSGSPTTGGKVGSNGTATPNTGGVTVVDPVEIQHGVVVPPSDASQVERVVVKKKPKSKCCVVM